MGKYIKASQVMEKDISELLPLAMTKGELTAADIVDIDKIDVDTEPEPITDFEATLYETGEGKRVIGKLRVSFDSVSLISNTLELSSSFILSEAAEANLC